MESAESFIGRILTPEQIDALAALKPTPGSWRPSTHNAPADIDRGKIWADLPAASGGMRCVGEANRHFVIRADQLLMAAAPDLLATVVYGREQVLRLTRERDTLAEGCCVDCGGSGVGPDACDAGDHFTPSCHSCGGTGMSPTVRRVVKERDEARAEVERLRAALEGRAPTLAEANLAHLHATLQARARRP